MNSRRLKKLLKTIRDNNKEINEKTQEINTFWDNIQKELEEIIIEELIEKP